MATADPPSPAQENTAEMSRNESWEEVEARQRKEVKELHARVQAMKKRVPKGNKKERKQVLDEVSRLEQELEDRHRRETEQNELRNKSKEESEFEKEEGSKKTRAQRRRERKEAREEILNDLIADMDTAESEGDRERLKLTKILTPLGLRIHDVDPDGDCMYTSLCHQLKAVRGEVASVGELRRKCAEYIRSHRSHYEQFLSEVTDPFEQYCHQIEHSKVWGGDLELAALSQSLQANIRILQAGDQTQIFGENFFSPPLLLSYHKHLYHMGEHYNSLIPD